MSNFENRNSAGLVSALVIMVCTCGWVFREAFEEPNQVPIKPAQVAEGFPSASSTKKIKFVKAKPKPLSEIDLRSKSTGPVLPVERGEAFSQLRRKVPTAEVTFDEISGAPSHLQATGRFLTGKNSGKKAADIVRDYVAEYPGLFGHPAEFLNQAKVAREDVTAHNGMSTLVWQQQHLGIRLYNTIFKANVTRDGEIVTLNDHFLPDPAGAAGAQDALPDLTAEAAIVAAAAGLGDEVAPADLKADGNAEGVEQKQQFTTQKLSDTSAHLTWLPLSAEEMRLAWDVVTFSLARNEMYQSVIDAETGEVLTRRSLTADISDASYRVFTSDSPSPFSPGHANVSSVQPPEVPRQLVTLSSLNTTASPEGWIPDGGTTTLGNNVQAHTDRDGNNVADLPRPNAPSRVFDFPVDLTQDPNTYRDGAVTNLFYWSNVFHDQMYELGFTESSGNFQTNNFGRGGLGNDAVIADAQDGVDIGNANNANYSSPPDGSPGRMQMFLWTGPNPDRDGDFEMEVVLHELAHGVTNRLVGGGVGISSNASAGMGEGWSDFYGLAMLAEAGDDVNASWARGAWSRYLLSGTFTENYYYGGRRYPYTTNKRKNPLTLRDIDPTQQNVHPGIPRNPMVANTADQVHNMGNVWCVTLWDMRTNLILKHGFAVGNQMALRLVTDGCKLSPANPNFLQARDGIIQADLVSNGGANAKELWAAFAKRGMGAAATAPVATTTVGISETYDEPDTLAVTPVNTFDTLGVVGGPFSVNSRVYTITNNGGTPVNWTASKTQSWTDLSAASGTLTAGASTTLSWSLNSGANALAIGEQMDTLTITNTTTNVTQERPLSLIVNGSPVAQTITFPAISPKAAVAASFTLNATASSSLPVSYTVVSGPATVSGSTVTLTGVTGAVTIRASQAGNALFLPATDVLRGFVVGSGFAFSKVSNGQAGIWTAAIRSDGTLWTWGGSNSSGNLADTTSTGRVSPTQIGAVNTWSDVFAGLNHGLALRSNGTLWGWGFNSNGQVGDGTTATKTTPTQIGTATNWAKINAGSSFSAAIRSDGTLWMWGANASSQLGDGTTTQRTSPGQLGTATNWVSVACASTHTLAVNSSGELWAWGANGTSQLGDGTTTTSTVPLRIGVATNWASVAAALSSSYALKTDGTLWAWGSNGAGQLGDGTTATKTTPTQIGTDTTWTQISAGANNAAARRADGSVWVWGSNSSGQLGNGTTTSSTSPVQFAGTSNDWAFITVGTSFITAFRNDGSLWAAGEGSGGTGVHPRALALGAASTSVWTQLTGTNGTFHAIRLDGTLWGFGANSLSQVGNASTTEVRTVTQVGTATDWRQVSGGISHSLGVKTGGSLWAWGSNATNQLGDGTTTTRNAPTQIGTATDWQQVVAGSGFSMAVKTTGSLWGWGTNGSGQLGDGTTVTKTTPTQIGTATDWAKVAVSPQHTLLLKTNGTLWACGFNGSGQLGDGTTTQRTTPVQVGTDTNWTEIAAAGTSFSLALKSNGTLWSWGHGFYGQLGSGSTANRSSPAQVGADTDWVKIIPGNHSTLAIKTDGSIWACGLNAFGQLGNGQTATAVTTLTRIGTDIGWQHAAMGANSMVALRSDGFWTAGPPAGGRTLAAGRDARILAPILPALQSQSFTSLSASYSTYQSPLTISTTSGLTPTLSVISGPATVSGNQVTLLGNGAVVLSGQQYGDDAAWNAIPPTRMSFTVGNSLAVSFSAPGSTGLTSNGFDARNVTLTPTLGFAPTPGTLLTLVNNTGSGAIIGTLPGIPQDGYLTMMFGGVPYGFRVDYAGGDGNDIVLIQEQAAQAITVAQINPKLPTDAPFTISGSSTSTLPMTYTVVTGPATVSGSTVTLTGAAGAVTLRASQAGNAQFYPAQDVLVTFAVGGGVKYAQISTPNTGNFTAAIRTDGTLWTWGQNTSNQLGDGTTTSRFTPLQIGAVTTWSRVSAGSAHMLALRTDGTLWAWGSNTASQLGDGTTTTRTSPTQIGSVNTWTRISASSASASMAVRSDGTLWAWGTNTNGQLGVGDTATRTTPTQVGTDTNWADVYTGQSHTLALKTNGTLWAWGANNNGQLGVGDTTNRSTPVQVGTATNWKMAAGSLHTVAVRTDGTLWAWGLNTAGQLGDGTTTNRSLPVQVGFQSDWSVVGSGNVHSTAIKSDGSLWAWGGNTTAQVGNGVAVSPQTQPVRVGTATDWAVAQGNTAGNTALKTDGTVWAWGESGGFSGLWPRAFSRALPPSANSQVFTSGTHTLMRRSDGTLWAWGSGSSSQLGTGSTLNSDPVQIGTATTWQTVRPGNFFSAAIRTDGTLWMWGTNLSNQLGDGTTTTRSTPIQIGSATDWDQIFPSSTSGSHTLAIKTGGTLWAWGVNTNGQHGDGTTANKSSPTQIGSATNWSKAAGGSSHTIAVRSDGTLWAAGQNTFGQLGDGTTTQRTTFVQIGTATDWTQVATANTTSYALKNNGTLWAWGSNTNGQIGDGSTTQRNSPVQVGTDTDWAAIVAGTSHAAALKTDGSLWVWGLNSSGQLGNGSITQVNSPVRFGTQSGWVSVSCGGTHTLAVRNEGSVWTAGNNAGLRLTSASGRSQFAIAPVLPALSSQTINTTPIGTNPYRFTTSSGLPVQLSLVSGQATITGNEINVTGPPGTPVVLLAWQPGDEAAWNAAGPEQITIGTLSPPVIDSITHANVDGSGADLGAVVNANGALTSVSFQYGTSPTLATFTATPSQNAGSGTSSAPTPVFSIAGLSSSTTYYYRALATSAGGTVTSAIQSFTTLGIDLTVEQPAATEIASGASLAYGNVNMGQNGVLAFTLKNTVPGTAVSIGTITLSGADSPHFSLNTAGTAYSIISGQSTTFSVIFAPALAGSRSITLSIPSNDPDENPFTVTLTGTGVAVPGPGQSIFGPTSLANRFVSDGTLSLAGFGATSGMPVNISVVGGTGGTIAGTTFTPNSSGGPVTLRITQAGGSGYDAAAPVYRTFSVGLGKFSKLAQGPMASHALGIKTDGTLWGWGMNTSGQLGRGNVLEGRTPTQIGTATNWTESAVGAEFSVAIRGGTLWAWGENAAGQLGLGDTTDRNVPVQVGVATTWSTLAAGTDFVVALQTNGTLWAWGNNSSGQLGLGDTTNRSTPTQIGALTTWTAVAAGSAHVVARQSGTLWSWGLNSSSQLGLGDTTIRTSPVQIGTSTAWSTKISCAANSSFAIQSTIAGPLYGWGSGANFILGNGSSTNLTAPTQIGSLSTWTFIYPGTVHAIALRNDGSIWSWGAGHPEGPLGQGDSASRSTPVRVGADADWTAVCGTAANTYAIKSNGSLWSCGANNHGQLAYPAPRLAPIATGGFLSFGENQFASHFIRSDGTLWGMGSNYSDLGDGTTTPRPLPVQIGTATNWQNLAAGRSHTLALRSDGTLWAAGINTNGQLGDGGTTTRTSFVQIGSAQWLKVSAGQSHSAGIRSDGTLWAWGLNSNGQVGDNSTTQRNAPVQIGTASDWTEVKCGGSHTLALRSTGTLWAWGNNANNQLGDGTTTQRNFPVQIGNGPLGTWSQIAAGGNQSIGIESGLLKVWGVFGQNQYSSPIGVSFPVEVYTDWVQINAGIDHVMALRANGEAHNWGGNQYGQLGTGSTSDRPSISPIGQGWTKLGNSSQASHSLLLSADGTLWGVGNNADYQVSSLAKVNSLLDFAHPGISTQEIVFPPVVVGSYNTATPLAATATSGLPVTYYVSGPATVSGNQLTVTGPGEVKLFAYQDGARSVWHNTYLAQTVVSTPNSAPSIVSVNLGGVTDSAAFAWGRVNPQGGNTHASFRWGTDPTLATFNTTPGEAIPTGNSDVWLTGEWLTPLSPATVYYYQLVVTNSVGTTMSAIGTFSTTQADISVGTILGAEFTSGVTVVDAGPTALGGDGVHLNVLRIRNLGGALLNLGALSISGPGAAHFTLTADPSGSSIAQNFSVDLAVLYRPLTTGAHTATLTIPSNDPDGNPFVLGFSGSGVVVAGPTQTIFGPDSLKPRFLADGAFALPFGATSGLPVTIQVVGGTAATLSGSTLTPTGAGSVTLKISQPGGSGYDAATTIYRTIAIADGKFTKLAIGGVANHGLAIKADGTLWAWGVNSSGQIGNGSTTNSYALVPVDSANNWTAAAVGGSFSVGIRSGTLWSWGSNTSGQLGQGDTTQRLTPTQVGSFNNWVSVAATSFTAFAIRSDGTLWAWGINSSGQIGDGTTIQRNSPIQVGTATNWATVVCGAGFTLARRTDGTLWSWGPNTTGQLGLGDTVSRNVPTQIGTQSNWSSMGAATGSSWATRTDGTLWAWGSNSVGQLGDGTTTQWNSPVQIGVDTNWVSVCGGSTQAIGYRADGTLWRFGSPNFSGGGFINGTFSTTPVQIGTDTDWTEFSCASGGAAAIKADGTLWTTATGNGSGYLGTINPNPVPIATGGVSVSTTSSSHTHFIKPNGTLWGVGANAGVGNMGDGTKTSHPTPVQIGTDTNWLDVSASSQHTLALRSNGTLWSTGNNGSGQLGDGSAVSKSSFTQAGSGLWQGISAGSGFSAAIGTDGTLWTWGANTNGQLGLGDSTQRNSPTRVGTNSNWTHVFCGDAHMLARASDGSIWSWGSNSSGQLGVGDTTQRTSPVRIGTNSDWAGIAVSSGFSAAIKTNGSIWTWGSNSVGQLGVGDLVNRTSPTLVGSDSDWVQVSTSGSSGASGNLIALKSNGTLWVCGANSLGQLGNGTVTTSSSLIQFGSSNAWIKTGRPNITSAVTGITADGTLWGIGATSDLQLTSAPRVSTLFNSIHPGVSTQTIAFPPVSVTAFNTPIPLAATATSGLPVTYYVSGPATLSGNQLTVTGPGEVKLTAYQAGERPAWHNAPVVQATILSILESWRLANFGTTANTSNTADGADFDNDGETNFSEFAFGTNPASNTSGPGVLVTTGGLGGGTLVSRGKAIVVFEPTTTGTDYRAIFIRRKDHATSRLTYIPKFSSSMVTWQNSTVIPTVLADDGTYQAVSVPFPRFIGGKKARFFILSVEVIP